MLLDGLTTLWVFALMLIGGATLIVLLYRGVRAVLSTTAQNWSLSKRFAIQVAATLGAVFLIILTASPHPAGLRLAVASRRKRQGD